MSHETNFYQFGTGGDLECIFGPLEPCDGPFVEIEMSGLKLAHLMYRAGAFASVGEAKRNGWDRQVPRGYNEFRVGKNKHRVCIWWPEEVAK